MGEVSERKNDVSMQHGSILCRIIELLYQRERNLPGVGEQSCPGDRWCRLSWVQHYVEAEALSLWVPIRTRLLQLLPASRRYKHGLPDLARASIVFRLLAGTVTRQLACWRSSTARVGDVGS